MTEAPAAVLLLEDQRTITAVQTVCFWLQNELGIADPDHLDLTMVIENRWLHDRHPDRDIRHLEDACRRFVSLLESLPTNPEVQP